nr:MAG TPA: hypothetical protein [Caudoviricetes sp.]
MICTTAAGLKGMGRGSPKSHPLPHRGGLKKISGGIFWEWGLPLGCSI